VGPPQHIEESEDRMFYSFPVGVGCFLTIWFCYWLTNVFPSLSKPSCKVAIFVFPVICAAILIAFPDLGLEAVGNFFQSFSLPGDRWIAALTTAMAIILSVTTLLITLLVAQLSTKKTRMTR
jgi:hypothetical protein